MISTAIDHLTVYETLDSLNAETTTRCALRLSGYHHCHRGRYPSKPQAGNTSKYLFTQQILLLLLVITLQYRD